MRGALPGLGLIVMAGLSLVPGLALADSCRLDPPPDIALRFWNDPSYMENAQSELKYYINRVGDFETCFELREAELIREQQALVGKYKDGNYSTEEVAAGQASYDALGAEHARMRELYQRRIAELNETVERWNQMLARHNGTW